MPSILKIKLGYEVFSEGLEKILFILHYPSYALHRKNIMDINSPVFDHANILRQYS